MDRSAVKAIVDREIEPIMKRLGIPHWKIRIGYEPRTAPDDNGVVWKGECLKKVDYNSAGITLNPEAFDNEEEVLGTLRHELFHVVLAPIDVLTNALAPLLESDPIRQAMAESIRYHVIEKCVINLERMYYGLTHVDPSPPTFHPNQG